MNRFAGRFDLQLMNRRHHIGYPDMTDSCRSKDFGRFGLGFLVAGQDHDRLAPGLNDDPGIADDRVPVTAIGATSQQDNVRLDFHQHLQPVFRRIFGADDFQHPGPGAHRHFFGSFGSHARHVAERHHPQAAGGAAG